MSNLNRAEAVAKARAEGRAEGLRLVRDFVVMLGAVRTDEETVAFIDGALSKVEQMAGHGVGR